MGWFSKNKKEEAKFSLSELPKLPSLPKLDSRDFDSNESLPQLPSLPSSSFGEKFSQNAIKDAVSGSSGKKGGMEDADESEDVMMQMPPKNFAHEEHKRRMDGKRTEPVFVRIDKFEESMHVFEKAEKKIGEMEELFRDIKKLKEEEERELDSWENKIQLVKKQIEKIDNEIFSKIE